MTLQELPVRRPVTTAMLFLALALLGAISYYQLPVELLPNVEGDTLYVSCLRPGSDPETLERELIIPIEGKIARLKGIEQISAVVERDSATVTVELKPRTNSRLTLLDLQRIAEEALVDQPFGTSVVASDSFIDVASRFIMQASIRGGDDVNALRDLAEDRIAPRLESVDGVSAVWITGGRKRVVDVVLDEERAEAHGVSPTRVATVLGAANRARAFLGAVDDSDLRYQVTLDGRFSNLRAIRYLVVQEPGPIYVKDVADVRYALARQDSYYRVNGESAVGAIVFKDETANLLETGAALRKRIAELDEELREQGVSLVVELDGSEYLQDQFDRIEQLALGGFAIVLLVLLIFLRDWRPMVVMATAIPASLLIACLLMKMAGMTLNIFSMVGLVVGVGILVDNSIVVFENITRLRERGLDTAAAVSQGTGEVMRAVLAGTVTNAVVFLPIAWIEHDTRPFLIIIALAIVLPLVASLVVALGLVPMLAARVRVRASGALAESEGTIGRRSRPRRAELASMIGLKSVLRHPIRTVWVMVVAFLLTAIIVLPIVSAAFTPDRPPQDRLDVVLELPRGSSLERTDRNVERIEAAAAELDGIEEVRSTVRERDARLTLMFAEEEDRPEEFSVREVRERIDELARELPDVTVRTDVSNTSASGDEGGALFGGGDVGTVTLTGPDTRRLTRLGREVRSRLRSFEAIRSVRTDEIRGQPEVQFLPDLPVMDSWQLSMQDLSQVLTAVRRDGIEQSIPFNDVRGDEVALVFKTDGSESRRLTDLRRLKVQAGSTFVPLELLGRVRIDEGPSAIVRQDRQRQLEVHFRLSDRAPSSGARLVALRDEIDTALTTMYMPSGYTMEIEHQQDGFAWFKQIFLPMLFLLFVVLALTFESFELPFLVFLSVPLTLIGALWSLLMTGTGAMEPMALMGAVCLLGLTVNPAIIMIDRMQQLVRERGFRPSRAALQSARDRVRPVMMTGITTIAGLVPLALKTGAENEIWPPFAIVVIGGIVASTLLTLLAAPMGFVLLKGLRAWLSWLGPVAAVAATAGGAAFCWWLFDNGWIENLFWQAVFAVLFWFAALGIASGVVYPWKRSTPFEVPTDVPLEVRFRRLRKIYGGEGRVMRQWHLYERWLDDQLARGGVPIEARGQWIRLYHLLPLLAAVAFMQDFLDNRFWLLVLTGVAWWLLDSVVATVVRARGGMDARGRAQPGPILRWVRRALPALAVAWGLWWCDIAWWVMAILVALGLVIALAARTGRRVLDGELPVQLAEGRLRSLRSGWRRLCQSVFGLGAGGEVVQALAGVDLTLKPGMWGLLGPNGAGKTTIMRILCQVLEPTRGTIYVNGHRMRDHRAAMQKLIGYLPQDFGLHDEFTPREYLEYYALLNDVRDREERDALITRLLDEVGLLERQHDKVKGFSGGMRQRVAIARTLVNLPRIVVVDEPTVGLDPKERIRFRNLLTRLSKDRIVLFSTHVIEDIAVSRQYVAVLDRGHLVFTGPPEELRVSAEGQVWEVTAELSDVPRLQRDHKVVRHQRLDEGRARVRILGEPPTGSEAQSVEPTLEEAYMWLREREASA